MRTWQKWFRGALGGITLAGTVALAAETEQRVGELDQKVRIIERKLELAEESAQAKAREATLLKAGKDGFALSSADGAFLLKLRGYVQTDARFYLSDDEKPATDTFALRRVRPIFEGVLGKSVDFRIMPDFGGGSTVLQDAYLGYTASPILKLRIGKFKAPFGLERLQSATDILFIERAHPTSLAPNRDIGLQVFGDVGDGVLQYALGAFNGVSDGGSADADSNDGKDLVGRLFTEPLKNSEVPLLAGLGLGFAVSVGDQEGSVSAPGLPSFKTTGQQTFFSYKTSTNEAEAVIADGQRTRIGPQAWYYWNSLGVLAEYTVSSQEVLKGNKTKTLDNDAGQVAISYVLTGEEASFKGVVPKKPLDPAKRQWGAWELAARLSQLNVDDAAFPDFADSKKSAKATSTWGVGVNWYLSKNAKVGAEVFPPSINCGLPEIPTSPPQVRMPMSLPRPRCRK